MVFIVVLLLGLGGISQAQSVPACKLFVDEEGIYQVTGQMMLDAGLKPTEIDPRRLSLTAGGQPVPLSFSGAEDGRWDPQDVLEFYGEPLHGRYSRHGEYGDTNVYWLRWDGPPGARIVTKRRAPEAGSVPIQSVRERVHLEQQARRVGLGYSDPRRDSWMWLGVLPGQDQEVTFEVHDPLPEATVQLRVRLQGVSLVRHEVQLRVNGVPVGDRTWAGQQEMIFTCDIPATAPFLRDGKNTLRISVRQRTTDPNAVPDVIYLDWIEVEYERFLRAVRDELPFEMERPGRYDFEADGFSTPHISIYRLPYLELLPYAIERSERGYRVRFSDAPSQPARYLLIAASNKRPLRAIQPEVPTQGWHLKGPLRSPENQADYVIITYDAFYDAVLPLAQLRNQDFRTVVVKVQDIYDEFNEGRLSPEAIRDFLRYAYQSWKKPAPRYVLLVGDASWDFYRGQNYIPASYFHSFKWGQAATDHHYACLQGNDLLPDLYVGRLPTRSVEETRAVVNKILRYEREREPGDWRQRALFIAARGSFLRDSEALIRDYFAPDYIVERVYTDPKSPHYGSTPQVLDYWNEGVGLVHFTGHGGGSIWSDEGIFKLEDVSLLLNGPRTPVVMSFTCFTGYFDDPGKQGLNESLVLKPEGGAIAAIGSTGLGWVKGDYYLEQAIFDVLMRQKERRLGPLLAAAKIRLLNEHPESLDLVRLYNLLGDPALQVPLALPQADVRVSTPAPGNVRVSGTIAGIAQGEVTIDLRGEGGRRLLRRTAPVTNGRFQLTIPLPKSDVEPRSVHVYAMSDQNEAVGGAWLTAPARPLPDLAVSPDGLRVERLAENRYRLVAQVENRGTLAASSIRVTFYRGDPIAGGVSLGQVVIPELPPGSQEEVSVEWNTSNEAGLISVFADPQAQIAELDETNNLAQRRFVFHSLLIGSGGGVFTSRDGAFLCRIEPGNWDTERALGIETVLAEKLYQPDLEGIPLASGEANNAYRVTVDGEENAEANAVLTFHYAEGTDPTALAIYRFDAATGYWHRLNESQVDPAHRSVSVRVRNLGTFALFRSQDDESPHVEITILDTQYEYDGAYVSPQPTIQVLAEDANGIGEVWIALDGIRVSEESDTLARFDGGHASTLMYTPLLEDGPHEVEATAYDLNGNRRTVSLTFSVGQRARLRAVANHPNPIVKNETWFTYVLTRPGLSGRIRIYATSGRLIAELEDIPVEQGYNEIAWDVTDRDGELVANGIYLYKVSITLEDGEKLNYVGKLAVAR